jgi:Na+/phosphate symporter
MDEVFALVSFLVMIGIVGFLMWTMLKSIRDEMRRSNVRKVWKHFGLSLVLCILFFVSWGTQAFVEWEAFRNQQREHGEPARVDEYLVEFAQSTLENWQSEFLQLFSFVTLAALFIHRGSAESKDGTDRIEEMVREIKAKLDA